MNQYIIVTGPVETIDGIRQAVSRAKEIGEGDVCIYRLDKIVKHTPSGVKIKEAKS